MKNLACHIAALALVLGAPALAMQADARPGDAGAALLAAERQMSYDSDGRDGVFNLATEWGRPRTDGMTGAIFTMMRANHIFSRHLTTGDFRQDLLLGFDSKANLKVAVLDSGIGDSCTALAEDTFTLTLASRARNLTIDGSTTRKYTAGDKSGCFVQFVGRSDELRAYFKQSGDLPVFLKLNVSGEEYPVFVSLPAGRKAFWQPATLMKLRQNFAVNGG